MSFRTAIRRLRASGSNFGFGSRFTLTVRMPRDAFAVPFPVPSAELAAHLEGYESTGDYGVGKKFGDGTGARLQVLDRIVKDGVVGTYATALVGRVRQNDEDWWDVTEAVEKSQDDDGWSWLREYADNVMAQSRWVEENVQRANWSCAALNEAWSSARAACSALYWCRDTLNGIDVWYVTFAVRPHYAEDVRALAKSISRFVCAAKRAGINARYF